jgi:hypothetical protein
VGQIPADTPQDHRTVEMTAFEHRNASQDLGGWYICDRARQASRRMRGNLHVVSRWS